MEFAFHPDLTYLDQCLTDLDSLRRLRASLDKLEKCCLAARDRHNLADIVSDKDNRESLMKAFGEAGFDTGVQILLKLSLADFSSHSIVTYAEITGKQKLGFLARCLGGWKQFNTVLALQYPPTSAWQPICLINPRNPVHWKTLTSIPEGTLCTAFFKIIVGKKSRTQEELAAERFEAIFDTVQSRNEVEEAPAPSVQVTAAARKTGPTVMNRHAPTRPRRTMEEPTASAPAMVLKVIINKMDVVVHAGNANLLVHHLRNYAGKVLFYVLRPEKKPISLDPDSIWSAEIRNGETVLFEFFGQRPSEAFVKELASCVNRYTQMDKIANE